MELDNYQEMGEEYRESSKDDKGEDTVIRKIATAIALALSLVLLSLVLQSTATSAPKSHAVMAAPVKVTHPIGVVSARLGLHLRQGPSIHTKSQLILAHGARLEILDRHTNPDGSVWLHVRTLHGHVGWVFARWVRIDP